MDIIEVLEQFPDQDSCIEYLESVRWQDKPTCPYCKSTNSTALPKEKRHHCNNCNTSYSVTVGTIFHHTHIPIQKWLLAVTLILNAKKGISSRQLGRDLKVHRNTAWRIGMKIREAMLDKGQRDLLTGIVETDETFIGGKPRKGASKDIKRGRGTSKTPVVGMIERGGDIVAKAVKRGDLTSRKLSMLVRENVDVDNALLITDEYRGYVGISRILPHETVNHQVWYVDGLRHTNSVESFWALLKRGIVGQYHKVSVRHLPKYITEFCFRHNNRDIDYLFEVTIGKGLGV